MITGGVKFFEPNQNLAVNGASISASSGNTSAVYALDRNPFTYWRSVSSNDLTTETIEVDLPSVVSINRLLFLDLNWKQFTVKYDLSGVWTDFTSVSGLDGSLAGGISETTFHDNTAYYEFAPVSTGKIQIQILKTQVVDQDKYVAQIISTTEIGTLLGFPKIKPIGLSRNERSAQALSGRYIIQKSDESASFQISFENYTPAQAYNGDLDLTMTLFDRDDPFIVWLCGGRRGTNYFNYTLRGFRLLDAYTMQINRPFDLSYDTSVYSLGVNSIVQLQEHI